MPELSPNLLCAGSPSLGAAGEPPSLRPSLPAPVQTPESMAVRAGDCDSKTEFALGDRERCCCLAIRVLKFSGDGLAMCDDRLGRKHLGAQGAGLERTEIRQDSLLGSPTLSLPKGSPEGVEPSCQSAYFHFQSCCWLPVPVEKAFTFPCGNTRAYSLLSKSLLCP